MKTMMAAVLGVWVLAGCASTPHAANDNVRLGMSRDELRAHFGEPLRIVKTPEGGEDWYYHFANHHWSSTSSTTNDDGGHTTTSYSSSWSISVGTVDRPVHIAFDGYVMGPLPEGKIVGN